MDRDSGAGFAKVYFAQHPLNAVDLLASRVFPFFRRFNRQIKEVYTPRTAEYCGIPPHHVFEAFLASSHVQHDVISPRYAPLCDLCEQFYAHLLTACLKPALRKKFDLSLEELQRDVDEFVDNCNSTKFVDKILRPLP